MAKLCLMQVIYVELTMYFLRENMFLPFLHPSRVVFASTFFQRYFISFLCRKKTLIFLAIAYIVEYVDGSTALILPDHLRKATTTKSAKTRRG